MLLHLLTAAFVKVFGCRPMTVVAHTPGAGVRKPPREETDIARPKSRHGSSFSAIKMQRLQTDRLRRTRAVHIAFVAFAMRNLFFILFQQARAVLFETAQWPRFTGWLTS
jgi:hypothetical protein